MDAQIMDFIVRFETRTRQLLLQYKKLQQQNALLQEKLAKREEEILNIQIENEELKEKYTHLKMAKYMDLVDDDSKSIRSRINKMVRDIDKCIAVLKAE